MNGRSNHTFVRYNTGGERFGVLQHLKTDQGIKNLNRREAAAMRASGPDQATREADPG